MMNTQDDAANAVAIIGMSGRFPGAPSVEALWDELREGHELISDVPTPPGAISNAAGPNRRYVGRRGLLTNVELFDSDFFGYAPSEAAVLDPQHRIFLECAYEALEKAGYLPAHGKRIGVYAGASTSGYAQRLVTASATLGAELVTIGTDKDFLATRVSYKLGLTGPSLSIQTGCSTSLVTVHLACQALLDYECDTALAGGVSLILPHEYGYFYEPGSIEAPDGHCRPFDAEAAGTVPGDGAGVVVLRRLCDALDDGDYIHAIIRGSAINNDGADKVGYTAPSVEGQATVVAAALAAADVESSSIGYVEAHGTGTRLGDPIEVAALARAFGSGDRGFPCAIGSIKSTLGHLDTAAGVTGLIKAALAVEHGFIPATLHFKRPNPELRLMDTPFEVAASGRAWPRGLRPRRAGVSSFGVGGTNAHVVLEEPPNAQTAPSLRPWEPLTVTAHSARALSRACEQVADHLEQHPGVILADAAWTLSMGRERFEHRACIVARDSVQAAEALRKTARAVAPQKVLGAPQVVFLLPGQGVQHAGMAHAPYAQEPAFRKAFDACADYLKPLLRVDLRELLLQVPGTTDPRAEALLRETEVAQPALVAVEYATAAVWLDWGIEPAALLGHSIGELTAACLAGVMPIDVALALAVHRGRLMQSSPRGAMVAVGLPQDDVRREIEGSALAVAAVNAPGVTVIAGPEMEIAKLQQAVSRRGLLARTIATSHAFHSPLMDGAVDAFAAEVAKVTLRPPQIPYLSNVTGRWAQNDEVTRPEYWGRQLRSTVQFMQCVEQLDGPGWTAIEVGPGRTLSALVAQRKGSPLPAAPSLYKAVEGEPSRPFAAAVTHLVRCGLELDWARFYGPGRRYVPLPTYPFERRRHWAPDPRQRRSVRDTPLNPEPSMFAPTWSRAPRNGEMLLDPLTRGWLVLSEDAPIAAELVSRLQQAGANAVHAGTSSWRADSRRSYNTADSDVFASLIDSISRDTSLPIHVIYALTPQPRDVILADYTRHSFDTAIQLASAATQRKAAVTQFDVVAPGLGNVLPGDRVDAAAASLLGLLRVLGQEHPGLRPRAIDTQPNAGGEALLAELLQPPREPVVLLRHGQRWVQRFERLEPGNCGQPGTLSPGVLLITGAFGTLGALIAKHFSRRGAALALLGRHEGSAERRSALAARCRATGAQVVTVEADVGNAGDLSRAIADAECQLGPVRGVIHAAGVTSAEAFGPALTLDPRVREAHFKAKVDGTIALNAALERPGVGRCLSMSSLSAVLGGLGYGAYAAANAFEDAFAVDRRAAGDERWISVGWDGWAPSSKESAQALLSTVEGMQALECAWNLDEPHVLVTKTDLPRRFDEWARPAVNRSNSSNRVSAKASATHPKIPTNVISRIALVLADVLGIDAMEGSDDFFDLGGHSLLAVSAASLLSAQLGQAVPVHELVDRRTPNALAEWFNGKSVDDDSLDAPVPIVLRPGRSDVALVLAYPIGGEIDCYRSVVGLLKWPGTVIGLRGAHLDNVSEHYVTLPRMAEAAIPKIGEALPYGRLFVGGWSFGGVLAFEIAHQLEIGGRAPDGLVLLDAPCPGSENYLPAEALDEAQLLATFAVEQAERAAVPTGELVLAGRQHSFDAVVTAMRRCGLWVGGAEPLHLLTAGYRNRLAALEAYVPKPRSDALTVITAPDPSPSLIESHTPSSIGQPPDGWTRLAQGGVHTVSGSGTHATMLNPPHDAIVASALDDYLTRGTSSASFTPEGQA